MAGKGGGAWKVAYADFVTAMMAFFLVMWIVAQNKPVREAIAQYFNHPNGVGTQPGGMNATVQMRKTGDGSGVKVNTRGPRSRGKGAEAATQSDDSNEQKGGIGARKPSLLVLHDGDNTHAGTVVPFAEASAVLDERGKFRLQELVPTLKGKPNKIEVRGHTSARPLPTNSEFIDAWQLSYVRCQTVMAFLTENGIEPERIRLSQAGAHEPLTLRVDTGLQSQNSRVEVYMLGEFVDDFKGTKKERTGATARHD